jgi:hypothetical protein
MTVLVPAAASLVDIRLLVTTDKHRLDIGEDALWLAFSEADLASIYPVHARRRSRGLR